MATALSAHGYLADEGLATAGYLAMRLGRPLFLEGEPGVGKTAFAQALAEATGARFVRLQCYEGLDVAQALYDWDFPRQILHLRAMEARGERPDEASAREEVQRLSRLAYRLIWVNPHRGKAGYAPLAGGMAAALPYLDEFVAGHSVGALEDLVRVIARA